IVVALVDDQYAVVLQYGVELRQSAATVVFLEQVRKGVAEAYDGIEELILHVAIQPAPVGVDGAHDVAVILGVLEGLDQHLGIAVTTGDIEAGLEQLHGVEAGAGGHIEYIVLVELLELLDEEGTFTLGPGFPVDQLVP